MDFMVWSTGYTRVWGPSPGLSGHGDDVIVRGIDSSDRIIFLAT